MAGRGKGGRRVRHVLDGDDLRAAVLRDRHGFPVETPRSGRPLFCEVHSPAKQRRSERLGQPARLGLPDFLDVAADAADKRRHVRAPGEDFGRPASHSQKGLLFVNASVLFDDAEKAELGLSKRAAEVVLGYAIAWAFQERPQGDLDHRQGVMETDVKHRLT
jgi:hypothetical protein